VDTETINGSEIVAIQLQDGRTIDCAVISIFPVGQLNKQFIALNPLYNTGFGNIDEIHLFSLAPMNNGNYFELAVIDEPAFDLVLSEFNKIAEALG
jgi:hypothetical protein